MKNSRLSLLGAVVMSFTFILSSCAQMAVAPAFFREIDTSEQVTKYDTNTEAAKTFYVSADASEGGDGSESKPFRSLEEARDAIRAVKADTGLPEGGITVYIASGEYYMGESFTLTEEDSGTESCPIYYVAEEKYGARLTGAKKIDTSGMTKYKDNIYSVDLKVSGFTAEDFGEMFPEGSVAWTRPEGYNGMYPSEFFLNGTRIKLARYPNEGFLNITEIVDNGDTTVGSLRGGTFKYTDEVKDRINSWASADDVWTFGYFRWDWSDSFAPVGSFDIENNALTMAWPSSWGYKADAKYYFYNVFEELDAPGEYYLDRENCVIYFHCEDTSSEPELLVSVSDAAYLINMDKCSYITVKGLDVGYTRMYGVCAQACDSVRVTQCRISNARTCGAVINGYNNSLDNCEITRIGMVGVIFGGGDTATLTPGNSIITNNIISYTGDVNRAYMSSIDFGGVGNILSHNKLYGNPHQAIGTGGNECIIEYNEIYDVCLEGSDCGAIYMVSNYNCYGYVIRYNYIHDVGGISSDTNGIYFDNCTSGVTAYGNLLINITGYAVDVGGGRDFNIYNNVFIDSKTIRYDARAYDGIYTNGWFGNVMQPGVAEYESLFSVPRTEGIWAEKYPNFANVSPDYQNMDKDDPYLVVNPAFSVVKDNVYYGTAMDFNVATRVNQFSDVRIPKYISDYRDLPGYDNGNYTIKENAYIYELIPGFDVVNIDEVGPIND